MAEISYWDYLVTSMEADDIDALATLQRLGAQGWELVAVNVERHADDKSYTFFLKRPLKAREALERTEHEAELAFDEGT